MSAILQTTLLNAFSWMTMLEFQLQFRWSVFTRVKLIIFRVMVQIMAWRQPGDKPLSEPMMVRSLTHICVTRPQWVITKCGISCFLWFDNALLPRHINGNIIDCYLYARFMRSEGHRNRQNRKYRMRNQGLSLVGRQAHGTRLTYHLAPIAWPRYLFMVSEAPWMVVLTLWLFFKQWFWSFIYH